MDSVPFQTIFLCYFQQFPCGYQYPDFKGANRDPLEQTENMEALSSQNDPGQAGYKNDRRGDERVGGVVLKAILVT